MFQSQKALLIKMEKKICNGQRALELEQHPAHTLEQKDNWSAHVKLLELPITGSEGKWKLLCVDVLLDGLC